MGVYGIPWMDASYGINSLSLDIWQIYIESPSRDVKGTPFNIDMPFIKESSQAKPRLHASANVMTIFCLSS